MEQRQTDISVGKGLQESRINQEFVDALKKWGPYVVMALSLVALAYFGFNRYQMQQDQNKDAGFIAYSEAVISRNPAGLLSVADTYAGAGSVEHLARLAAADIFLEAARTGVPVDVTVSREGQLPEGKSLLTKEQRDEMLTSAKAQFEKVVALAGNDTSKTLVAIGGLNGVAAVAEIRGDLDAARAAYTRVQELAKGRFDILGAAAAKRIETLGTLASARLFAAAELPTPPETPVVTPMTNMTGRTSDGRTITINPDGTITQDGGPAGGSQPVQVTPVPAPAPAPAPAPGTP